MKFKTLLIGLGRIASKLENDPLRYHPCTHAGVLFSSFGKKHFLLTGIYDTNEPCPRTQNLEFGYASVFFWAMGLESLKLFYRNYFLEITLLKTN